MAYHGASKDDRSHLIIAADTQAQAMAIAQIYGVTNVPELIHGCHWFGDEPQLIGSVPEEFAKRNAQIDAARAKP